MNTQESIISIPLEKLHVSTLNTRQPKPGDKTVKSLAKSLAEFGQTTPLIVRPFPDRDGEFEIAAGARRRVAGEVAKLETLGCVVRQLDDREFEELILIENLQREDPDPKAEADLLERLTGGRDVVKSDTSGLAARCGKPESWVARRLRLLDLSPALRKEWRGGFLDHAPVEMMEFLGSLPRPVQDEVFDQRELGYCRSRKDAKELVEKRFACRFDDAPFPLDDERFFGECGTSGCASDSRDQPLLFGDFEDSKCGRCLNRSCFQGRLAKWRAHKLESVAKGEADLVYVSRNYVGMLEMPGGRTIEPLQLWQLESKHRLEVGKKSDGGSRRAIDLSNPDKPRSIYLVPIASLTNGKSSPEAEIPTDKADDRRQMHQARRWAKVLEALQEALASAELTSVQADVFELAAVFGVPFRHVGRDDSWKRYDNRDPGQLAERVWEGLARVFAERLLCGRVGEVPSTLPEMRRVAALIGFDLDAAKIEADGELPAAKSWGENIDPHSLEPLAMAV